MTFTLEHALTRNCLRQSCNIFCEGSLRKRRTQSKFWRGEHFKRIYRLGLRGLISTEIYFVGGGLKLEIAHTFALVYYMYSGVILRCQ